MGTRYVDDLEEILNYKPEHCLSVECPTTWVGFCAVEEKRVEAAPRVGSVNIGQSCYINVALPAVFNVRKPGVVFCVIKPMSWLPSFCALPQHLQNSKAVMETRRTALNSFEQS